MSSEQVRFAWTEDLVGPRVNYYPPEEGNRVRPFSDRIWSRVETLPPERIREIQWLKLKALVDHVYAQSGFYRRLWQEHGFSPAELRSWEDYQRIPIITKEDIESNQRQFPPFGDLWTIPPSEQMVYWQTSGTTGPPRKFAEGKEDLENNAYLFFRTFYAHGIRPGWRGFFAFGYPPFQAFWLAHYAAQMMGCQCVPKGPLPTDIWLGIVKSLQGSAPSFLATTPTYAIRHIEVAQKMGLDLRSLGIKVLLLAGEPGAAVPATKQVLEAAWGAEAHDVMGATELSGPILFSCDVQAKNHEPAEHLNTDYFIVEVLDPVTLKPTDAERGALCVTSLYRYGMPGIRFLLGDYVELVHGQCGCGRTLPLVKGGIRGRIDDMIIVKGVNLYPSMVENSIRSINGLVPEYQIVRKGMDVAIRVEALPEVAGEQYAELARAVQTDIQDKVNVTLAVEVAKPGTLPRFEVKSKRVVVEES